LSAVEGRCACGAAGYTVSQAPDEVTECNCTLCTKLGGRWAYYAPADVALVGETIAFVRGDMAKPGLATHHCARCGAITHWAALDPTYARMGVNVRLLDPAVIEDAAIRRVDGLSWDKDAG
jgi:hypothetical protein